MSVFEKWQILMPRTLTVSQYSQVIVASLFCLRWTFLPRFNFRQKKLMFC